MATYTTNPLTDYLASPEYAASEALRDTFTTEQLERLNRLQIAQTIVIQTTDAKGNSQITKACSAVIMAMRNDMNAPVELLVDDSLRILGAS